MYIKLLKDMFENMVINKNADLISLYYHPELLLYTNNIVIDYDEFFSSHIKYYATPIQYQIAYDEDTLFESGERVAGRVWITTSLPNESAKKIEVMLIAQYKDEKIYRLWELTYPDWSQLPAFQE